MCNPPLIPRLYQSYYVSFFHVCIRFALLSTRLTSAARQTASLIVAFTTCEHNLTACAFLFPLIGLFPFTVHRWIAF